MIKCGQYEIQSIVNGDVFLDGGAMFGVVPRVLWAKKNKPDELHRIRLATRTLLAVNHDAKRVILVDTGTGTKWSEESASRYGITHIESAIPDALNTIGLDELDVTDVIVTHLHFDHNGGLTVWADQDQQTTRLRYPNATHWIHRQHLEHTMSPSPKDRASYLKHDFEHLVSTDQFQLINGDEPASTIPGIQWIISHGHTPAQLLPLFEDATNPLFFTGDMIPTISHLPITWVMAYDMEPLKTISEKQRTYQNCHDQSWRLAFPHDPDAGIIEIDTSNINKPVVTQMFDAKANS